MEMNNPGVWILGSVAEDIRGAGWGSVWSTLQARRTATCALGRSALGLSEFRRSRRESRAGRSDSDAYPEGRTRWARNGEMVDQWPYLRRPGRAEGFTRGRRYRLAFNNRTAEAHPLHLHRNTFELVRIGARATSGVRKDVIVASAVSNSGSRFCAAARGLGTIPLPSANAYGDGF